MFLFLLISSYRNKQVFIVVENFVVLTYWHIAAKSTCLEQTALHDTDIHYTDIYSTVWVGKTFWNVKYVEW